MLTSKQPMSSDTSYKMEGLGRIAIKGILSLRITEQMKDFIPLQESGGRGWGQNLVCVRPQA